MQALRRLEATWLRTKVSFLISKLQSAVKIVEGLFDNFKEPKYFSLLRRTLGVFSRHESKCPRAAFRQPEPSFCECLNGMKGHKHSGILFVPTVFPSATARNSVWF